MYCSEYSIYEKFCGFHSLMKIVEVAIYKINIELKDFCVQHDLANTKHYIFRLCNHETFLPCDFIYTVIS